MTQAAREPAADSTETAVGSAFTSALRAMQCAQRVVEGFLLYDAAFRAVTRRAPARFAARDWPGSQRDAVERIELYEEHVRRTIAELEKNFGATANDRIFCREVKRHFANLIEGLPDNEFCKTFFSSITRKLFKTVGVAADIEFVATDLDPLASAGTQVPLMKQEVGKSITGALTDLLQGLQLSAPWSDLPASAAHIAAEIDAQLGAACPIETIEIIGAVFYHFTRAYVVGHVRGRGLRLPLALAFKNTDAGVTVDNVMLTEAELSNLFGYTRSYFHVELDHVADAIAYLRTLMPQTPVGELFTVLGRAKQGKTERHRSLIQHLHASTDLFQHAPGQRGLVMVCFTLPSLDVVFKVIRDRIPLQKNLIREEVIDKYNFVFKHDRAGRLVDAQEFRRLRFPRARFTATLLQELLSEAASLVHQDGDDVVVEHAYIERRVTPLDIYLQTAAPEDGVRAALDYGYAIRDMAYTDIFAGDLLLKNFGVTQHGRVVFYDYDEVVPLKACNFRELPQASHHEEEMSAEPWFAVSDADVFPETFLNFLPFSPLQRQEVLRFHDEIFRAQFWRGVQTRLRGGEILDVMPYVKRPDGNGSLTS